MKSLQSTAAPTTTKPTTPPEASAPNTRNNESAPPQYHKRARWSVLALGARAILQQPIIFAATVYLTRTLERADYGVFGIVHFSLSFFTLVGDAGLAASLVQRKQLPDSRILSGLWWTQLALAVVLMALAFVTAPLLPLVFDDIPATAPWLLRGLSVSLLFTILRAIPFMLLERDVRFGKVGALELLGTACFYGTAVILASQGAGAATLVIATVVQSAVIAIGANILSPFRPKLVFDWHAIKDHIRFGVSFQVIHVAGFVNNAVTPLFVGARMGADALGTVNFAQSTAWISTAMIGIVRRVSFPYFSRLQTDLDAFAEEFNNAIALCAVPVFFFAGIFLGNGSTIVTAIYSEKWLVAVPVLLVYALMFVVAFFGWIAGAAIEALGRPDICLRVAILSTVINWVVSATVVSIWPQPLAFALGFSVHVLVSNVGLYLALRRMVPGIRPVMRSLPFVFAGAIIAGLGRLVVAPWLDGVVTVVAWFVLAAVIYGGIVLTANENLRRKLLKWLEPHWSRLRRTG